MLQENYFLLGGKLLRLEAAPLKPKTLKLKILVVLYRKIKSEKIIKFSSRNLKK